jgi:hypothetical protein
MKTLSHSLWLIAVLALIAACTVTLIAMSGKVMWVGRTDVQFRFRVGEETSDTAIPNATIRIETQDPDLPPELTPPPFMLTTDSQGRAEYLIEQCVISGTDGFFEKRSSIRLPRWTLKASANGYFPSHPQSLNGSDLQNQMEQSATGRILTVPITMRRQPGDGR